MRRAAVMNADLVTLRLFVATGAAHVLPIGTWPRT
jgi:hypothetical protein